MSAMRPLVLAALWLAAAADARVTLPPYDVTGHWSGTVVVGAQQLDVEADLVANGATRFTGTGVVSDVQCTLRGKRAKKLVVKLRCHDGTKGKLAGAFDTVSGTAAGGGRVVKRGHHAAASFTLSKTTPAVCGNGAVEGVEQCDDGNTTPGDGCDAACMAEISTAVDEVEPNDDPAEATVVPSLPAFLNGAVTTGGDQDFFRIVITGRDLLLETFDSNGPGSCAAGTDTILELRSADGVTVVAVDDDGGLGTCSRIELHGIAPGVYYPCVRAVSPSSSVPLYRLRVIAP
jgi:cysteine-rich repeat protein